MELLVQYNPTCGKRLNSTLISLFHMSLCQGDTKLSSCDVHVSYSIPLFFRADIYILKPPLKRQKNILCLGGCKYLLFNENLPDCPQIACFTQRLRSHLKCVGNSRQPLFTFHLTRFIVFQSDSRSPYIHWFGSHHNCWILEMPISDPYNYNFIGFTDIAQRTTRSSAARYIQ